MGGDAVVAHRLGRAGGRGPTVVLVHGMEDSWHSWGEYANRLPASWRIFAFDLPWRSGNSYTWRREATVGRWLARGLDQFDRPVDVLIGHSLGANAVMEFLARPDAGAPVAATLLAPFYRGRKNPVSWGLFHEARRYFERIIGDGMRLRLGPRVAALDDQLREAMLEKMLDRIGPLGFLAWFDHFAASAGLRLDSVDVPTLILASGDDPCLADGRADALAADMPAATLRLDDTYDHFCHVQQAAAVAAHTARFVRGRLAARGRTRQSRRSAA